MHKVCKINDFLFILKMKSHAYTRNVINQFRPNTVLQYEVSHTTSLINSQLP